MFVQLLFCLGHQGGGVLQLLFQLLPALLQPAHAVVIQQGGEEGRAIGKAAGGQRGGELRLQLR